MQFFKLLLAVVGTLSSAFHAHGVQPLTPEVLATSGSWLRLGHYVEQQFSSTGWQSEIHSEDFFLSASGRSNPAAELRATIAALSLPPSTEPDHHAQCRFPARAQWLRAQGVDIPSWDTKTQCPKLADWTRDKRISSISVVFATGYLGNPASYYGHTLLKFNSPESPEHSRLMDVSVNYGAILEGAVDPLSYIAKGIFGGYDGGFSHIHFYFHDHNYGENELRDLWEYRLNLPQEAVDLIVAHAWEVLGKRYTYYFFKRNCAYRMGEILEIVDNISVIDHAQPWTIPQSLIQSLAQASYRGNKLVDRVTYHPSRQSRLYEKHALLERADADLVEAVVTETESILSARFDARPVAAKHLILDTLIDYYRFVDITPDNQETAARHPRYIDALAARYRLPPGQPTIEHEIPARPDQGRPPAWLQAGWRHDQDGADGFLLRIRPAYYDALDSGSGQVPNSALAMGDTTLIASRGRLRLHRLDLVAIESVSPARTGLPGDRGRAWRLRAGAEQLRNGCQPCVVGRAQGDIGIGRRWSEAIFGAAYVGGAIHENLHNEGFGFVRATLTTHLQPTSEIGVKLAYEYRIRTGTDKPGYAVWQSEARLALGQRNDFRISYEHDGTGVGTVSFGHYW